MCNTATELISQIDDADDIIRMFSGIEKAASSDAIRSNDEFQDVYLSLIVNRLIEANSKNEFSQKFSGSFGDIRLASQALFKRIIQYAENQENQDAKRNLFLWLCYLKPESPDFASRIAELNDCPRISTRPVSAEFRAYIGQMLTGRGANDPGLSFARHFGNTRVVSLAEESMQCRVARVPGRSGGSIYCGCSSTDSLLFDSVKREFDAYITLPGLSLKHLRVEILEDIYRSIVRPMVLPVYAMVTITICVGFVDCLKIAGAANEWDKGRLQTVLEQSVNSAIACIKKVNEKGRGSFEFKLYPGHFPVRTVDRTTVNGVAPFYPENMSAIFIVGELLESTGVFDSSLFPHRATIRDSALIHDREIHPKLGMCVADLV